MLTTAMHIDIIQYHHVLCMYMYADHIVHITSLQARIMVVSLVKLVMNYSSQFKVDQTPYLVKGLRAH